MTQNVQRWSHPVCIWTKLRVRRGGRLVSLPSGSLVRHFDFGEGPVPCVANITGDSRLEIVAGTTVYKLPDPPPGVTKIADWAAARGHSVAAAG